MTARNTILAMLTPPDECEAFMGLPFPDRRKGGIWHCRLAKLNIGKGKTRPACRCRQALEAASSSLSTLPSGEQP